MFWKNDTQKNFKKQMKEIEKDLKSKEKENTGLLSNNLFKLRFYGYSHQSKRVRFGRMFSGGIFSILGFIFVIRIILGIGSFFFQQSYLSSDPINSYYEGDYSQTIAYSDRLLNKDHNDYNALLFKAKSLRALEKYEEALECLKFIEVTGRENDIEVLLEFGNCYSELGQHIDAVKYYERAMELSPYNDILAAAIGWEYFYLGEYEKASEFANKAFILNNENIDAIELTGKLEKKTPEIKKDKI